MKNIEEIKAQIIKDNVGINHNNDKALYKRIVDEFVKRGLPFTYMGFDKNYPFIIYDVEKGIINCINSNYSIINSINIITLEEFIARYPVEEREIIGWNFKDIETVSNCFTNNLLKRHENRLFDFVVGSIREDCLKKLGVLEILCEPVYKEVEKRGEFIGLPVEPPSQISFNTKEGSTPILKLCGNGDIFVKGKLIENDKEVVDALREFVKHIKFE